MKYILKLKFGCSYRYFKSVVLGAQLELLEVFLHYETVILRYFKVDELFMPVMLNFVFTGGQR